MSDPILVHMPNGPAPVWAAGRGATSRPSTSKKRSIKEAGDRGTVAEIAESNYYKEISRDTKRDTLKTLERATPKHRPCFHLALSLLPYRSRL